MTRLNPLISFGSPNGTRTRVAGVRGQYPRPLDDGTFYVAGGRGFEPLLTGPEPVVLPLNDPPTTLYLWRFLQQKSSKKNKDIYPAKRQA